MPLITKPDFTYVWASGGAVVAPNDAKKQLGWVAEAPPFQYDNWLQNRQDQMLAHVNQHGIAVWDTVTEYQGSKSYVQGSNGRIYTSVINSTNQDPVTDSANTYWKLAFVHQPTLAVLTTSGNFIVPPNIYSIEVEGWSGGGGGGGSGTAGQTAGGGGGGGYARSVIAVTPGQVIAYLIGAAGAGGVGSSAGSAGGTTSFGAFFSITGATGGQPNPVGAGGAGGVATGGTINFGGAGGGSGIGTLNGGSGGGAVSGGQGGQGSAGTGNFGTGPGGGGAGRGSGTSGNGATGSAGRINIIY